MTGCTQTQAPLSASDVDFMNSLQRRVRPAGFVVVAAFVAVLAVVEVVLIALLFNVPDRGDGNAAMVASGLILLMIVVVGGLCYYVVRHALKVYRTAHASRWVIGGACRKTVCTGRLTGMSPGERPGVRYMFGDAHVDVAVAPWNDVLADTDSGQRPSATCCRTGVDVALHLVAVHAGHQPLLLRADYAGSPLATIEGADVTAAEKNASQNATTIVHAFTWIFGGILFLAGLIAGAWPFALAGVLFVGLGYLPNGRARAVAGSSRKRVVSGVVDEILTYRPLRGAVTPTGASTLHRDNVFAWRIGGELYHLENDHLDTRPGDTVRYSYIERADGVRVPVSVRTADGKEHEIV